MVKVRIEQSDEKPRSRTQVRESAPRPPEGPTVRGPRGMSERQWFISLLVATGLLLLVTFRGCVLPSGVGPQSPPAAVPTETPAETPQPQEGVTEYEVQPGDTLGRIAEKTGTSIDAIVEVNEGITRQTILRVGQTLTIPQE